MQKGFQLKKLHLLNRKCKEKSMNLCFCNVFDMIQSDKVDDAYWGHSKFIGLKETMFTLPTGPNFKALSGCKTIGKIFDVVWSGISTHILEETRKRERMDWNVDDMNLFPISQLVMGLTPQPSLEDYFKNDSDSIFG